MGRFVAALCVVVVFTPWFFKCLSDSSINLNRMALNFASTIQEIITRSPSKWEAPQQQQPAPEQRKRDGV